MKTSNRRFPLTSILALCVGTVALLSFSGLLPTQSLRAERFYVKDFPYRAIAACRQDQSQCLVVVTKGLQGWRGSRLDAALATVGGWFNLVSDVPETLKPQAELLRLGNGERNQASARVTVERRVVNDLDIAGELVTDGDGLYYVSSYAGMSGDDDGDEVESVAADDDENSSPFVAKGWRWDGQNFSPVPAEQAKQLAARSLKEKRRRARLQLSGRAGRNVGADSAQAVDDAQAGTDGWRIYDEYVSVVGEYPYQHSSFKLAGNDWRLRFQFEGDLTRPLEGAATLKLAPALASLAPTPRGSEQALASYGGQWEQIDLARYEALANKRMPEAAFATYFGRHFMPYGIVQLSFFLLFLTLPYWTLRGALIRSASHTSYYPDARPENFPALDRAKLDDYTRELEAEGFVHARDYAVTPSSNKFLLPSFGRLFINPARGCFAEVGQLFTVRKNPQYAGMRCTVISHFAGGRTFATTDRDPDSISYALRRPENLWSARPGAAVAQLIEWHLHTRREIELVLDIPVSTNLTPESFFARTGESIAHQRAALRKRVRLLLPFLVEDARLKSKKRFDWLGDYGIAPAPAGWVPPVEAEASGADGRPQSAAQVLIARWSAVITFVTGVALCLSIYFWLLQPTHLRGTLLLRAGLSAFGLLGFFLLKFANRQPA